MNKALIRYLEDRFVQIARECKRYNVLTKSTYSRTVMKEAHIAAMEEFIDNVRVLINALGYKVLEPTVQNTSSSTQDDEILYLNTFLERTSFDNSSAARFVYVMQRILSFGLSMIHLCTIDFISVVFPLPAGAFIKKQLFNLLATLSPPLYSWEA